MYIFLPLMIPKTNRRNAYDTVSERKSKQMTQQQLNKYAIK